MPEKKIPDMLRFIGGTVKKHEVGWDGPWPPPEIMRLAVGTQSGIVQVVAEDLDAETEAELAASPTIVVTTYKLRNASILNEDQIRDMPNVFRGAEYVPVTDD
jgi:hypothetical protein